MNYVLEKSSVPSKRAKEIVFEKLNTAVLYKESGKPYTDKMNISISHSGENVLVGFNDLDIGVDIEVIKDFDKRLISRYFSENEQNFIKSDNDFFLIWTVKEAYLKLTGVGLKGMKKLNVIKDNELYIENCKIETFVKDNCRIAIVYRRERIL